jgi:hypothetical protein
MGKTDGPCSKAPPSGQDLEEAEGPLVDRYTASLEAFLQEVSAALTELQQDVPQLTASMKKRPDQLLSMLPRILPFEQMSFLEIQYSLPGTAGKRPGIRFWLEGAKNEKRLRAILFEDTRVWDVSYDLEKLHTELGTFFLQGSEIIARPAAALSGKKAAGSDWRGFLRTLLRVPIP